MELQRMNGLYWSWTPEPNDHISGSSEPAGCLNDWLTAKALCMSLQPNMTCGEAEADESQRCREVLCMVSERHFAQVL